jgi:two-component system cell cycle sensor histidine kinase/response regulator CckA
MPDTLAPMPPPVLDEPAAALVRGERLMVVVRWFAVAFAVVQVLAYTGPAPAGTALRGLTLAAVLAAYNAATSVALRAVRGRRGAVTLAVTTLAADTTLASAFVWLYAFDPTSALWALLLIVVLEGATRLQLPGALGVWVLVTVLYTAKDVWAAERYGLPLQWNSITFRMGIALLIGLIGGLMARDLDRQRRAVAASLGEVARVTEEAARATSQRLQAVFDAAPLAICELDLDARVRRWSRAAEEILGLPADAVLEQRLPDVTAPDDRDAFVGLLDAARAGEARTGMELTVTRVDGETRHLAVATAPLRTDRDGITGVLVLAADVTERKRVEEQALQAQRMEAVGRLAGGIAHDFNNLMTVVMGYARTARRKLDAGRSIEADLDAIAMAGQRAADLVAQLLAFARQQRLEPRVVYLDDLVTELQPLLARLIDEHVRVEVVADPEVPPVLADPGQLEQVVVNLVINARDAMPEGGRLRIRTSRPADDLVELAVTDTGVGMSAETQARIFEPFFTTKAPGKGTGLGLSMVYGIVEASGGHLVVDSAPGAGTTIAVRLPARGALAASGNGDASAAALPAAAEPHDGGAGIVLLAEDEPSLRQLVAMSLELLGCTVLAAADGEDAAALADDLDAPLALVVTDVVMPRRSGPRLLADLRARWPELPAVVMSGYADANAGEVATDERTVFLPKPFEIEDLHAAVARLLGVEAP